jgi:hypothetical protein
MHIPLLYILCIILKLILQGIGPTLIAFRVSEEPHQTETKPKSRTSFLSHFTLGRTGRSINTVSQSRRTGVSTIPVGTAHKEEHTSSLHDCMGTEAQKETSDQHEPKEIVETITQIKNMGSH